MPARRAFSLIELLMVIAIIALVIDLALPALSGAREQARMAACASNLRQLQMATVLYVKDDPYHRFPYASFPITPMELKLHLVNPFDSWVYKMRPYLDPHRIAICPSDKSPHWTLERPFMPGRLREVSYGVNDALAQFALQACTIAWPNTPGFHGDVYGIKRPSNVIGFGELAESGSNFAIGDQFASSIFPVHDILNGPGHGRGPGRGYHYVLLADQIAVDHHQGHPQWSFMDGHVASPPRMEVFNPTSYDSFSHYVTWSANKFHPRIAR